MSPAALPAIADDALIAPIQETHLAIAKRTPAGLPRAAHDLIATAVYSGVRAGIRGAVFGASPLLRRDGALAVRAAVNALVGDRLAETGDPAAIRMQLCDPVDPAATPRAVVLVHGLGETERSWNLHAERHAGTYADALRAEGWTPLRLRYNSGLRVEANGRALSELLEEVVRGWPCELQELALVGHSMGGLVVRHAAHQAEASTWLPYAKRVVTLGAPHAGAPLARGVHVLAGGLSRVPETRGAARFLNYRSAGIRDLRKGIPDMPLCPGARHLFLGTSLRAPWGALLGDLLVTRASSCGEIEGAEVHHLEGLNHFHLLNHPQVRDELVRFLT